MTMSKKNGRAEADPLLVAHLAKLAKDARFFNDKALKAIPFPSIVEALYGKRVIPLPKDAPLADALKEAAELVTNRTQARTSERRINEEGNGFEPFVLRALVDVGLDAKRCEPSVGYPDLYIPRGAHEHTYVEVKTFASGSEKSTFRSFYMSPPSRKAKVKEDAHHVVMAFAHSGEKALSTTSWKVLDLSRLIVAIKLEIFATNKGMYNVSEAVVGQGVGPGRRDA